MAAQDSVQRGAQQIARRRITLPPVVVAVEVEDLTALAVAVGVLTSPTVRPVR